MTSAHALVVITNYKSEKVNVAVVRCDRKMKNPPGLKNMRRLYKYSFS
jgi:hypothetical protein